MDALSPAPGEGGRIADRVLSVLRGPRPPGGAPIVTLSWAQSRNGAIAGPNGERAALSGPESLVFTHRLRAMHTAILVGIGTVLSDDPLLSVRHVDGTQPQPVVLDSHLRMPLGARLLARADAKPWVFHAEALRKKVDVLRERGARLFRVPKAEGGLVLTAVLQVLSGLGVATIMVEGGARVLRTFLSQGLAAQAAITVSPVPLEGMVVLGDGRGGTRLPDFVESEQETHGADIVIWGRFGA